MPAPRIALFSPLPPLPTGIADYVVELMPALADAFEVVDVFHANDAPPPPAIAGANRVLPARLFEAVHARVPYDAVLYHQGNNRMHRFVYEQSLRVRGISVLHDPVLHHFISDLAHSSGDHGFYAAELRYSEGHVGEQVARTRARGLLKEWEHFLFPINQRVVERSDALVVHGAAALASLHRRYPDALVRRVRHHYVPPRASIDRLSASEARAKLGLPSGAFICGAFGFITPAKRIEVALEAFAPFARRNPDALFCAVGDDSRLDHELIRRLDIESQVRCTGMVDLDVFETYLRAVDCVLSLRYPSGGESSGSLVRALGAGKPTIVSHSALVADYPRELTLPVPVGEGEARAVRAALSWLRAHPDEARELGEQARAFVRVWCTREESARSYRRVVDETIGRQRRPLRTRPHPTHAWVEAALGDWASDEDRELLKSAEAVEPFHHALRELLRRPRKRVLVVNGPKAFAFVVADSTQSEVTVVGDSKEWVARNHLTGLRRALPVISQADLSSADDFDAVVVAGSASGEASPALTEARALAARARAELIRV